MTPIQLPGTTMSVVTAPFIERIVESGKVFQVVLKDGRVLTGTMDVGSQSDFELMTTDTLHQQVHEFNISDIERMNEI